MNIAIIPARGGSKRIPRKNIKTFAGKPMIAHAITAALESKLFDHVIVSTDDEEIATIALQWGAEIPFKRPHELADDFTPTVPVIAHAIKACKELGMNFNNACCIYPGVPFIQVDDLKAACDYMKTRDSGYCYPVTEFPSAIQRALRFFPDGRTRPFSPENEWTRTQDLEPAFYDAGQFYWGTVSSWLDGLGLQSNGWGLQIPQWRVVDIDTPEDWHRAEIFFNSVVTNKGK
jgi:pseudaminic acid cytidylyltransferase